MKKTAFRLLFGSILVVGLVLANQVNSQGHGLPTREDIQQWITLNLDSIPQFKEGDLLKQADLDKLRPFLPPRYIDEFNFPEVKFHVAPTGHYPPHPDYLAATEQ